MVSAGLAGFRGRSIVVTRPRGRAGEIARRLREEGARVVELPMIAIAYPRRTPELDTAIARLGTFDWIVFTSAHGVEGFWRRLRGLGKGTSSFRGRRVAAVGAATARALRRRGVRPDLVPSVQSARGLLAELRPASPRPARILLPRSDLAPRTLPDALRRRGHEVHDVVAYRTVPVPQPAPPVRRAARAASALVFFSPSAVRQFHHLGLRASRALVACIGPSTAASARQVGLRRIVVPAEPTPRAVVVALGQALAGADRP